MPRTRLLWKLYPTYLAVIVLSIATVAVYVWQSVGNFYMNHVKDDLHARATLVEKQFVQSVGGVSPAQIDTLCKQLGRASDTRITIIDPSGVVLGDSEEAPANMANHADRPEIIAALAGGEGSATRFSPTLEIDFMYVARRLGTPDSPSGVVRVSMPLTDIENTLSVVSQRIILAGLIVAVLAAGAALIVSKRISGPLEQMTRGAERFAEGDLIQKLPTPDVEEMRVLADALNEMAVQLNDKIRTISEQNQQQMAMLSSMVEGVVAVDTDHRVINLNQAAVIQLGLKDHHAEGKLIQEVVRSVELEEFVAATLSTEEASETHVVLHVGNGQRVLQVHGTSLLNSEGKRIGVLLVLHDVTRIQRLETIRRDFVANVSHELKTPITSIKGFVETLTEKADTPPDEARRFLEIISRQVDRLNAIIDDLLALSRIEQDAEHSQIERQQVNFKNVAAAAIADCRTKAEENNINIQLTSPEQVNVSINPHLMEQALVNLLDNAIKYSSPGGSIELEVESVARELRIIVADHGCGIASKYLPRLFERFYRVDKARSRKLGGTGLGLSIVKHIVQAHNGSVTVVSKPGVGSTFTISVPVVS